LSSDASLEAVSLTTDNLRVSLSNKTEQFSFSSLFYLSKYQLCRPSNARKKKEKGTEIEQRSFINHPK
jgi:hypothetical protein